METDKVQELETDKVEGLETDKVQDLDGQEVPVDVPEDVSEADARNFSTYGW
jgi:hypothetical protein